MSLLITTKFLAATNTKGQRVKVTGLGQSKVYNWDYELSTCSNHITCAKAFVGQMNNKFGLSEHQINKYPYKVVDYAMLHDNKGYAVIIN